MARKFIDRGGPFTGLNTGVRDSRADPLSARVLDNVRIPDGRLVRRDGFTEYRGLSGTVETRHVGSLLAKERSAVLSPVLIGTSSSNPKMQETRQVWRVPRSYGLIRWHDDFQPKLNSPWTVEFVVRLGEKDDALASWKSSTFSSPQKYGFRRILPGSYAHDTVNQPFEVRKIGGVFVYDQTVFANYCEVYDTDYGTLIDLSDTSTSAGKHYADLVALPALAVALAQDSNGKVIVSVEWTLVGHKVSPTSYAYIRGANQYIEWILTGVDWIEGSLLHVAVIYDPNDTNGSVSLYVNGVTDPTLKKSNQKSMTDGYTIDGWAGEYDYVNDFVITDNYRVQRDIVLLNECTARGAYSGAVLALKSFATSDGLPIPKHFGHYPYNTLQIPSSGTSPTLYTVDQPQPWCCSPPRGTGIGEIRIWNVARTASEILSYMNTEVSTSSNLLGYWKCRDGGLVLLDSSGNGRHGQVHQNFPAYVSDSGLISKLGLMFGESQGLTYPISPVASVGGDHIYGPVSSAFGYEGPDDYSTTEVIDRRAAFTVQIQFRTPYTFQQDLYSYMSGGSVAHGAMGSGAHINLGPLYDGHSTRTALASGTIFPFYQTLWSVEAWVKGNKGGTWYGEESHKHRVPVARGLLTPDGKVRFELYTRRVNGSASEPILYALESLGPLNPDTVYTLTFQLRHDLSTTAAGGEVVEPKMRIYFQAAGSFWYEESGVLPGNIIYLMNGNAFDLNIGCTGLHDTQWGIAAYERNVYPAKWNHPYGSAPGFFTLGMFRMWLGALSPDEIEHAGETTDLSDRDSPALFVDLLIDKVHGMEVPNRARYPVNFKLVYQSYMGGIEDYRPALKVGTGPDKILSQWTQSGETDQDEADVPIGLDAESSLSYASLVTFRRLRGGTSDQLQFSTCHGLGLFRSLLTGVSGLLAVQDNVLRYDDGFQGSFVDIPVSGSGPVADIFPGQYWQFVPIADRTILVGPGGIPKVFDGQAAFTAGIRRNLPPHIDVGRGSSGSFAASSWYGVVVAYVDQANVIYHISSRGLFYSNTGTESIIIRNIVGHPDPRITGVQLYLTDPQPDPLSALTAALKYLKVGTYAEGKSKAAVEIKSDATIPTVLDENVTPPPYCYYGAVYNDRLFLARDALIPDVIYWSAPGNPEWFDTVANKLVLEDSEGDQITALVPVFNSLLIFKEGSVWRLVETQPGTMSVTKLTEDIGCVSAESVVVFAREIDGAVVVFFWSRQGPYIYDGVRFTYVGRAIENGIYANKFGWIGDAKKLKALHLPLEREIVCFYDGTGNDLFDSAIVFNYGTGTWYRFTGLVGGPSLTVSAGARDNSLYVSTGNPVFAVSFELFALVGGVNGRIYRWSDRPSGTSDFYYDGIPSTYDKIRDPYTVSSWSSPELVLQVTSTTELPSYSGIEGLWITVYKSNLSQWFTVPIASVKKTGTYYDTLVLDTRFTSSLSFTPAAGDLVVIGRQFGRIEFPWDSLDLDFVKKQWIDGYVWGSGTWYRWVDTDWNRTTASTPRSLVLAAGAATRDYENKSAMVYKDTWMSLDNDAALDAVTNMVEFRED